MRMIRLMLLVVTLAISTVSSNWPIIDVTADEQTALEDGANEAQEVGHMRAWKRYQAILLCSSGAKVTDVAEQLDCATQSVYQWIKRWREAGIDGIRFRMNEERPAHYRRHKIDVDERIAQILAMRESGMCWKTIARELHYSTRAGPWLYLQRAFEQEEVT